MVIPLVSSAQSSQRTRVMRGRGQKEDLPWEMWRRAPLPELRGLVLGLWAGLTGRALAKHRVLPNGEVMLMFHLGPAQRLTEQDGAASDVLLHGGFIAGLQERPATYECFAPATRVAAVRLTPVGAWALLRGVPQSELAHRVFDIDMVLEANAGSRELRERMLHARDLGAALDVLEDWIVRRFRAGDEPHVATQLANHLLFEQSGSRVSVIARECGVSPRRLHELFVREVGLPPKRVARVLRFRQAIERLVRTPHADLRQVALATGYYDQSHLYRDFRELAGMTPLEYLVSVQGSLEDADVIGE